MSDQDAGNEHDAAHEQEDERKDGAELTEEDDFEFPPPKRRRPFALITAIVLIVVIVGGGLLVARTVGGGAFGPTPTPTPTLIPGENLFYITTSPAWGKISIDGHTIAHLPAIGSTPLTLATGGHTIKWDAPPFSPQQCTIYVPPQGSSGGACSTTDVQTVKSGKDTGLQATVVSFTANSSMLPAAQYTALVNATQAFLNSLQATDTVQPGEQFVDLNAPRSIATASQPLRATLHFRLDTNPNTNTPCIAVNIGGQSCQAVSGGCYSFCNATTIFNQEGAPTDATWDLYGVVGMSWDYATPGGQVVARDQPYTSDSTNPEYLIGFYVSWDGSSWHVTDQPSQSVNFAPTINPPCIPMQAVVEGSQVEASYFGITANVLTSVTLNGQVASLFWGQYAAGENAAAGCLGAASQTADNTATVTVNAPAAYCLYRFGVLLAANAQAHRYWPNMPVVDAYEQSIVQQLMPRS